MAGQLTHLELSARSGFYSKLYERQELQARLEAELEEQRLSMELADTGGAS